MSNTVMLNIPNYKMRLSWLIFQKGSAMEIVTVTDVM